MTSAPTSGTAPITVSQGNVLIGFAASPGPGDQGPGI
jgi:hypothetical protein